MEMGHGLEGREGGRKGGREGCESIPPHWRNRLCVYEWVYVCVCVSMYWGGVAFGLNHNTANYLLLTRKNERGPTYGQKKKQKKKSNRIVKKRWHIDCLVCASCKLAAILVFLLYIYVEEEQASTRREGKMRNWNARFYWGASLSSQARAHAQ